jgi:YD repeat-containing protein
MKTSSLLVLLAAWLFLGGPASGAQHSSLEGTWYVNGDRNQVARITERRRELEARNEHGQTSRLEYEGRGRVRARDWGGITGEIRGNRIEWSNNTYWSAPSIYILLQTPGERQPGRPCTRIQL